MILRGSNDAILVGEDTEIYCDIELIGVTLRSDIDINVVWIRDNVTLTNGTRVTISALTGDATDVHSTLTFSPVHSSDMVTYGCHVTLSPFLGSASPVTASDFLLLVVSGKCHDT